MREKKYRFNPETLTYEIEESAFFRNFIRFFLPKFLTALVLGILFFYAFSTFVKSPDDFLADEKNSDIKLKFELLNKELDYTVNALAVLQHRDDDVYRMIFQAEPVSDSKRKAGFGGNTRPKIYENIENADLLNNTIKKTDILSKVMLIQSESYNEIFDLVKNTEKLASCIPAIQPIALDDLTRFGSSFGLRFHPILKIWRMHEGIDLTAPRGTEIHAAGDGIVFKAANTHGGYGNVVKINHGFGYITVYAHMSKILVRPGQHVKRGDVIGLVGNTGLSEAPHLHYEVRINGRPVNPINFYYEDLTDEEYYAMIEASSKAETHIFE
ncbi:MAG: M23 family metallopeptidase [Chlorobi bacterium]|nr:M23 family metallopeptidase [Chlorobiota bacterium]